MVGEVWWSGGGVVEGLRRCGGSVVEVVGNYICRGRGRWQCFGQGPLGSERYQMAGQMVEKQKAKLGCKNANSNLMSESVIGFN